MPDYNLVLLMCPPISTSLIPKNLWNQLKEVTRIIKLIAQYEYVS